MGRTMLNIFVVTALPPQASDGTSRNRRGLIRSLRMLLPFDHAMVFAKDSDECREVAEILNLNGTVTEKGVDPRLADCLHVMEDRTILIQGVEFMRALGVADTKEGAVYRLLVDGSGMRAAYEVEAPCIERLISQPPRPRR